MTSPSVASLRLYQSVLLDPENYPEDAMKDVFTAATYDLADKNATSDDYYTENFEAKRKVAERLAHSAKNLLYQPAEQILLPKFKLAQADSAQTIIEFDSDIVVSGTTGFAYSDTIEGNWTQVTIEAQTGRTLRLSASPEGVSLLAYAPFTTPCANLNCSIYDSRGMPLQPRVIQVKSSASSGITVSVFAFLACFVTFLSVNFFDSK